MKNRIVDAINFKVIVARITERMQEHTRHMNDAVVSGNSIVEAEHRSSIRALDLMLFTLVLNSKEEEVANDSGITDIKPIDSIHS